MTHRVPARSYPALVCFLATFSSYIAILPSAMAAFRVLDTVPSDQAQEHIGETTTVCGLVASSRYLEWEGNRPTYLNFDHPYPNQTFAVMIPGASRAEFKKPPEAVFYGKTVCVTGLIVDYHGRPAIVVENPSQIVVQDAAPATAGATADTSQKSPGTASEATTNAKQKAPPPPPSSGTAKGVPSAQAQQHVG